MMNEHSVSDPLLQSLEARLAAAVPRVSAAEQQQLLYQCAFAAGRQAGVRTTRRWQATTATLAAVLLAVSLPQFIAKEQVAMQPAGQPSPPTVIERPQRTVQPDAQLTERTVDVQLDAWQMPDSEDPLHPQTLAQHDAAGSSANSLGSLTRQFLE